MNANRLINFLAHLDFSPFSSKQIFDVLKPMLLVIVMSDVPWPWRTT